MNPLNFDLSTAEGLANAVVWQTRLVNSIGKGGTWVVPRSFSVYRLSHDAKVACKLCGLPEPDIKKVFEAMGWTVRDLGDPVH